MIGAIFFIALLMSAIVFFIIEEMDGVIAGIFCGLGIVMLTVGVSELFDKKTTSFILDPVKQEIYRRDGTRFKILEYKLSSDSTGRVKIYGEEIKSPEKSEFTKFN